MMRDGPKTEAELLRYLSALRSRAAQPEQAELDRKTQNIEESEQIFRAIFDNAADGIVLADVDNKKFYMANKVFREMLGWDEDQLKDLGIADIHRAEDLPYVTEQFEKQARKELTLAEDIPVKRLDGSVFFADVNSFPVTLGQKTYLMGIFRDITERKEAAEEIRRLAGFPDENPNPVLKISADYTILYANKASSPLLETWVIQVGQRLPEPCCERAKEALGSGKVSTFDFNCDDGRIFLVTLTPVVEQGHLYAYGLDITERKQAEQALRESEEQFRIIFERAAEGILLLRAEDGKIIDFNEATCEQLGYTRAEFQKLTIADVEVIESAEDVVEHMQKVSRHRGDTFETKHRAKDGSIRERLVSCGVASIAGQERVVSIWNDVTEIRQAQEALRQSEQKWRSLAENAPDVITTVDLDGTILFINHPVEPLTQEQAIGTSLYDYIPSEHHSTMRNAIEQVVRTGEPCGYELAGTGPGGRISWYRSRIGPIKRDDQVIALTLIARDVTEHKQMEQALRESELRYRTLFETLPIGVGLATPDGRVIDGNSTMQQMTGRSLEELKHVNLQDMYVNPDERAMLVKRLRQDHTVRDFESELARKDGTPYYASLNVTPFRLRDETVLVTVARDITAHKKAQEELAQSEQTLRSLVNSITESVLLLDTKGTILAINSSAAKRLGHSADELIGKCAYGFLPAEIAEHRKYQVAEVVRTGRPAQFEDRPQGRILHHSLSPVFDACGKVERLAVFGLDLTERRRMQEALAESEQKYRTLVEAARDPILTIDRNGVLLFVNKAAATYLEGQAEELAGKTLWDVFPKEYADKHAAGVREVIDTAKGRNAIQLVEVPGSPRWFNTTLEPLTDSGGKVIAAMLIARDVHDMKQAEEQIERLSSAVEQSIDGISIGDAEHRLRYVNAAYARMHGYTAEEMIGMDIRDLQDKAQAVGYESVIHQIETQGAWTGERQHVKKDGTAFPCYISVTLLKNDMGQAAGRLAICKDMTQYKRTQQMMMIKDAAMASSINAIVIGDVEGNLTYVNDSFLKMWGYKEQNEVLGRNAAEFWEVNDETETIVEALKRDEGWIGELTARRKDGSPFDAQVCQTTIRDENGTIISLMASFLDITESKRSREELTLYREKMAHAEQLASLGSLSATVAHELTQPLTVIRLSLESALEKTERRSAPEIVTKKLRDSLNQVSNIVSLTERFRNFARKSSERTFRDVDLKALTERIMRLLGENSRRAGIAVRLDENMGELPPVHCHEKDMEQLFFALIDNAIRAAEGKKKRELVISGVVKDGHVELRFADDCGGIAPENLDRVFEPFFTTRPVGQGTGLGLCIVQEIVSRARGKVHVESKFGEGSTFFVTLPLTEDAAY